MTKAPGLFALVVAHTLSVSVALGGCAGLHTGGLKAVEAAACAVEDERLSVAFTDPAKAHAYLVDLVERLNGPETTTVIVDGMEVPLPVAVPSDAEAVAEVIKLIEALVGCIPTPSETPEASP